MELWNDRQHVWLRSRVGGGYLTADEDGVGVSTQRSRASMNAAWAVHVHQGEGVGYGMYLLLHGAAYGRYLAATDTPAPRGHRGFRVAQRNYDQPQVDAIMWQVIGAGFGSAVLLRNVTGGYLRANGKYLRWNDGVTVDEFENLSDMMDWIVEPIPPRQGMPAIPNVPAGDHFPGDFSVVVLRRPVAAWQRIRFVLATDDGFYHEGGYPAEGWSEILFRGRSAYRLRNELARRLRLTDRLFSMIMCVRAGRYGRLTPLVENLPRDGHAVVIEIVVIMSGTPAANALRHPDVDVDLNEE